MRLSLFRSCTLLVALLGFLCWGCSDDDVVLDAAVDAAQTTDKGAVEGSVPDLAAEATLPDTWDSDAGVPDSSQADMGPAPGFPPNVSMFINMGDSIAAGIGAASGHSYKELLMKNDDTAYPTYKGKDLKSKFSGIKMVDTAAVGALSSGLVTQAKSLSGNPKGDTVVVISIGGNDFAGAIIQLSLDAKAGTTLAKQVTANIDTALKTFADKTKYPGKVAVVLMTFHDPTDGAGKLPNVKGLTGFCQAILLAGPIVGPNVIKGMGLFNAELKAWAARKNVMIADYHARALGHGWNYQDKTNKYYDAKDPSLWFYTDCLHANDRGNHEMRSVIWERMFGK